MKEIELNILNFRNRYMTSKTVFESALRRYRAIFYFLRMTLFGAIVTFGHEIISNNIVSFTHIAIVALLSLTFLTAGKISELVSGLSKLELVPEIQQEKSDHWIQSATPLLPKIPDFADEVKLNKAINYSNKGKFKLVVSLDALIVLSNDYDLLFNDEQL